MYGSPDDFEGGCSLVKIHTRHSDENIAADNVVFVTNWELLLLVSRVSPGARADYITVMTHSRPELVERAKLEA